MAHDNQGHQLLRQHDYSGWAQDMWSASRAHAKTYPLALEKYDQVLSRRLGAFSSLAEDGRSIIIWIHYHHTRCIFLWFHVI